MTLSVPDSATADRTLLITGGLTPRVAPPPPRRADEATARSAAAEYSRGPADWHTEVLGSTAIACRGPW